MPGQTVLSVRGLTVEVATPAGSRRVVEDLGFDLAAGETLCIAGESGSGKSLTALSVMRLLPRPVARVAAGSVRLAGRDLLSLPPRAMRSVRGRDVAMIFQEPMTSLNPVLTVGRQLTEAILAHQAVSRREARQAALEMLNEVRIADAARRLAQYPHELSGGMRQRVMIAIALSCRPKVLIADEPTTALDVTIQAQILALMTEMQRAYDTALLLITHDMGVVAQMADRVLVMEEGRAVETGSVYDIFARPHEPYTRRLLAAVPRLGSHTGTERPVPAQASPVVEVRDLVVRFDITGGILQRPVRRVHAVEGVSFTLAQGETLALVGESGCGKSTTGRALMNLIPWRGEMRIGGRPVAPRAAAAALKRQRRDVQMIFQDPYASLDPRMTVGELVAEPLRIHDIARGSALADRVAWLFERVGLTPEQMGRYPHEFSGGQRQRVCIARALSLSPKVIIADESVSALDVSVQARVLALLMELQQEFGLSYVFISHDMAVIEQISHRVGVMYRGRIVEMGSRRQVFESPRHPYTRRLLSAVPVADPARRTGEFRRLEGEVPSAVHGLDYVPPPVTLHEAAPGHFVTLESAFG
jgi:peptide/nickel transport system ATP-binding protein